MAPSTPPPPPETSNAAATAATRPLFQNHPRPPASHPFHSAPPPRLPSNPNPNYPQLAPRPPHPQDPSQLLYPLASSGRGFLSRPVARPAQRPPFMFPYMDQGQGQSQGNPVFVRPNHLPHVLIGSGNSGGSGAMAKGIPLPSSHQPKGGPPSASVSDNNGHKDSRERAKDDALVIIRDRKVRAHEKASLYALCRSWLRNSFPEETQPQYLDTVKSLPRPLPAAAPDSYSPDKTAKYKEEEDEDMDSCEHLSEKELLQRHIKRAKRVRSWLGEERLQRITRYKTRLALLLPPMVEQHFKSESGPAN